jgi:phage terminase Nu1 subunit (DNA packaging protein)
MVNEKTVSAGLLAQCLGISRRTLERLARGGHVCRVGHGQYDLAQSVSVFIAYALSGQSSDHEPEGVSEARREVLVQQARRLRRENMVREGQLLEASFVEEVSAKAQQAVIGAVESLPGRCAAELTGMTDAAEIRSYLLTEVRRIRETWSQAFAELARIPDDPPKHCPVCRASPWSFQPGEKS